MASSSRWEGDVPSPAHSSFKNGCEWRGSSSESLFKRETWVDVPDSGSGEEGCAAGVDGVPGLSLSLSLT